MRGITRGRKIHVGIAAVVAVPLAVGTLPAGPAEAGATSTVTVLTANIAQKSTVPALRERIAQKKPDVVTTSESWNARAYLGSIPGYKKVQAGTGHQNQGGVTILIKTGSGIDVKQVSFLRMKHGFTGPGGKTQPPRVYPAVSIRKQNKTWRVLGVHFPWVKASNRLTSTTWKESADATVNYLKRGTTSANIAAGDFNSSPDQMRTMGARVPAVFVNGHTAVDHALAKRTESRSATNLGAPSGMHGWVFYKFVAKVIPGT